MTALAKERNTPQLANDGLAIPEEVYPMNGGSKVYAGSLACLNAEGNAVPGSTATTLIAAGRAQQTVDASAVADGVLTIHVQPGTFRFGNSSSTDAITIAQVGKMCFVVDDQTVAKTDGTGTRSPAGIVKAVDSSGVWVEVNLANSLQGNSQERIAALEA